MHVISLILQHIYHMHKLHVQRMSCLCNYIVAGAIFGVNVSDMTYLFDSLYNFNTNLLTNHEEFREISQIYVKFSPKVPVIFA